ncbi:BsuBI/PstI family type II restriction endonuclease [Mycobacterium sp. ACS4331]|uniref:BsuBI/PstI family type II restriction endonuclease n=1 Tax=Mycobacterium sp. ACS4331 TaxID=1834121 RepID=UPI0007FBD149|nr:BsuBI/PstI family type II restriction endonuclease [Mycobacterium sp. ACS4331]OBF25020.1 restriction endonuclease [Mycobacterium sp. ACS4331]
MVTPADKVTEARELLAAFGMDDERSNERSAMTLLSLLSLAPDDPWSSASNPMLGTRAIMDWIRDQYGVDYKPNTRETVRRFTLHQFADAQLVVQNPDQPDRPVNSPKWNYQITAEALEVIRLFGTPGFESAVKGYLEDLPGLREAYAAAREMNRVPVFLPDGDTVQLSPGGQNVLIKQIVDEFCAMFTPGAAVLYIGDASDKWAVFDENQLAALGVEVDQHGKMPDLVVYMADKNWLVLIEAASTHGPVDAKRHRELAKLFEGCTAGLVYVSAFPDRAEMRKYLTQIAWETDVWCADDATHLIHFNGERFLGPY